MAVNGYKGKKFIITAYTAEGYTIAYSQNGTALTGTYYDVSYNNGHTNYIYAAGSVTRLYVFTGTIKTDSDSFSYYNYGGGYWSELWVE